MWVILRDKMVLVQEVASGCKLLASVVSRCLFGSTKV